MIISKNHPTHANEVLARISNHSKSYGKADFLTTLFGPFSRDAKNATTPVALFGAGAVGKHLCQVLLLHGVKPTCFCDNDPSQIGRRHFEIPVISFAELKQTCRDTLILVASCKYASEIRQQLVDHGFSAERILSTSAIKNPELLSYYQHCGWYTQNPRHSLSIDDLQHNQKALSAAYNLLADQKSRDIFVARLSLFTSKLDFLRFSDYIVNYSDLNEKERDSFQFYVSPEDYGYFNNDVLSLKEGEILVDGGSYNGLSAATFAKTCEKMKLSYREIYCFEPDSGNFSLLQQNAALLPNTTCIRRGLWSQARTLTLLSARECDPGALLEACSNMAIETRAKKVEVETTSIDEEFPGGEITLIKMDIEGAESEAIRGAANTIRRCQPKLAISAYHKHSDIYELPLLIHSLCPAYRFYLRQYGYTLFDMVLFATP
jgi:FkbM family methyltransferase